MTTSPSAPGRSRLGAYSAAAELAFERGIVIADTKFELGFVDGELIICDEILTPDSSRFWPADSWGRCHASVVRQAAGARLGGVDGLGQGFGAATGAG